MTNAQKYRLEGFNASLAERGISLQISPDGPSFMAHVEPIGPDAGQFSVGSGVEREASDVHVLRADVPPGFVVGANLYDAENNRYHRIESVTDHPTNILVVARCETSEPSP